MKKYIIGFVCGIMVSVGAVGIFADVQSYSLEQYSLPVYINNVKYPTDALPVLSLDLNGGDNTYVPLRNFSEMMGADVDYNKQDGRIDITTTNKTNNSNNAVDHSNDTKPFEKPNNGNSSNSNASDKIVLKKLDKVYNDTYKLNVYTVNGVEYVDSEEIDNIYFEDRYKHGNDEYDFEDFDVKNATSIDLEYNDKVVLDNISVLPTNDDDNYLITFDYFVNNIYETVK